MIKQAPFKPTDIGGCKAWFDAFDASYTTTGNTVTAWTNKSGNANATTGSGTVSINQTTLNGKSSVRFAAGTNYLNIGSISYSTSYRNQFFVVTVGASGSFYWYLNCNDTICGQCYSWNNSDIEINRSGLNGIVTNNPTGFFSSTSFVSICTSSGGNTGIWVNGSNQTLSVNNVGTGGFFSAGTASGITLGGQNGFTTGNLDMYELLQYDGDLTTPQRQQIESYLAQKWGLRQQLPQGHPGTRGIVYPSQPIPTAIYWRYQSAFLPTQIQPGSCQLWLDAFDSSSVTVSGTNVISVRDKSGKGVVLSNATGYSYPNNSFNGTYPSFLPTDPNTIIGSHTLGVNTSFAVATPFTVAFVAKRVFTSNNGGTFLIDSGGPSGTNREYIWDPAGSFTWYVVTLTISTVTSPTSSVIVTELGTSPTFFANGTNALSSPSSTNFTTGGITIGNRYTLDSGFPGHICELIIYSTSLTIPERQQVEGYLAWKWGLQANLPANHPYKNSSPSTTNPLGISRPANVLPIPPITLYAIARPTTYVTGGLLFFLDAGNAASYPGTGSTWTDLAGSGLTTTLYGSPTYSSANGGYISFSPGNGHYGQTSASLATLSSWSLEVWHYYTATNTGSLPCIITEFWSSTPINFTLGSGSGSTSSLQVGYFNNAWYTTTGSYSLPSVGWYHIVGTYDGANLKLYVNNVLTQTSASTTASVSSALGIRFMRRWDNPEYWGGYLAIVRIYNRALSATEVTTNYSGNKARFGLS